MKQRNTFSLFFAVLMGLSGVAMGANQCASIMNPQQRLQCYDKMAGQARAGESANHQTQPQSTDPADQAMLKTLQQAWGKQIVRVHTGIGIMQVYTSFDTVNQVAYEVMVSTMCSAVVKQKKTYAKIKSIAILNQAQNQGYLFTPISECAEVAFKPVNQTRLVILGNTRKFKSR